MQSPLILISKVASLTLASTLVVSAVIHSGMAKAAREAPESTLPAKPVNGEQPVEVAQFTRNLLIYDTGEFRVRVYQSNGQTLMNVFDNVQGITRLSAAPVSTRTVQGQDAYVSFGTFNGRQVEYASQVFDKPQDPVGGFARFFILDQDRGPTGDVSVIRVEDAESIEVFDPLPPGFGSNITQRDTILFFETSGYAVRVFNRGGQRLMNVFNRRSGFQEVNGKLATLVNPVAPFENSVSYVSSANLNNQSVRYYARFDYCNDNATFLEIYDTNGTRILREGSGGVPENNIPLTDFPPGLPCGVGPDPTPNTRVNDAYVAAVFGDEDTLRRVKELGYNDAYLDTSSRQGDFINAGTYSSEEAAMIRVLELRRDGFDSRLVFRDVRFR